MGCARYENLLFDSLDAAVSPADQEFMREHQRDCASCREFAAMLRGEAGTSPVEVPDDLMAGIVASTSGSPCDRAQLLLAAIEDQSAVDELLQLHVDGCPECAAVSRALVRMRLELPSLASPDPGPDFVASVMAATVGAVTPLAAPDGVTGLMPAADPAANRDAELTPTSARERRPALPATLLPAMAALGGRVIQTWQRLAQRPRFAMEGAYVVALIAVLIFGLPTQSLAALPGRAFDGVRRESVNVERALSGHIETIAELGKTTWAESTSRAAELLSTAEGSDSARAFAGGLRRWAGTIRSWAANAFGGVLAPLFDNIADFFDEQSNPQPRSNQ